MNEELLLQWKKDNRITMFAVVAMDPNRLIGRNGGIPWHISQDLKVFKRLTMGHPIVMGRKTFESLNNPLPGRQNIVLTRSGDWKADGADVISTPEQLMNLNLMNNDIAIIGGAQIYEAFMPLIDTLWVSQVRKPYEGDTHFPEFEHLFRTMEVVEQFDEFDLICYGK